METSDQNSLQPNATGLFLVTPPGINATAVLARKSAIVAASPGMDPLRVEQLAIDAELQQHWHDHPESRTGGQFGGKSEAELLAADILKAQAADRALAAAEQAENKSAEPNEVALPEKNYRD